MGRSETPAPVSKTMVDEGVAVAPASAAGSTILEEPAGVDHVDAKVAAATEKTAGSLALSDALTFGAVPKPTLLNERGRSPKVGLPGDIVPTMAQGTGVRTLDDTIIELLRPMIRQWLDDNMPRMVEKALRIEVAASVKSKIDQSKH